MQKRFNLKISFSGLLLACGLLYFSTTGSALENPKTSQPAPDPIPRAITVASWNLEWFFDDFQPDNRSDLSKEQSAPSGSDWDWKLNEVSRVISKIKPTILCLQEIENRDVVWKLTQKLKEQHRLHYRVAFIQGQDFYTEQDVAIIYQSGLVQYSRREQSREMWDSKKYYNLQKHIFADFEWGTDQKKQKLTIINVHLRARAEAIDLRKRQCLLIHKWVEQKIKDGENVIVIGDLNTDERFGEETADGDMAAVRGLISADKSDDLIDLHEHLQGESRATHIGGKQLDRILVSKPLMDDEPGMKDLVFSRIVTRADLVIRGKGKDRNHFDNFYQIDARERDVSDHYPIMAEFLFK